MELLDSIVEMADLRNRESAEMPDICNLIQNAVSNRAAIRKSIRAIILGKLSRPENPPIAV
jgi:hypothetical protein